MLPLRLVLPATLLVLSAVPAGAASFDCGKASTPFEHAICDFPELSTADDRLAKTFATATGGLTKNAVMLMRADQRQWLDFAQRACTDDAKPLMRGNYGEAGGSCLVDLFNTRSGALEQSRMISGHRFFIQSSYLALQDPDEVGKPDSNWKVATHTLVMPQLDGDDPWSEPFNRFVTGAGTNEFEMMAPSGGEDGSSQSPSIDTSVTIAVKELGGTGRVTMDVTTYWYGHGAAHGNYSLSYLHYLTEQQRGLVAGDVFAGDDWASTLVDAAWEQLQLEHKEWLLIESAGDIAEIVVEPTRWDLSDDYGLVVQFQPYEVSAYAYGAPTITIPWDTLETIKAETQDQVRYGF